MKGRVAKRHDCGEYGQLTVSEIAVVAGVCVNAIYRRLGDGANEADLCKPKGVRKGVRKGCGPSYRSEAVHTSGHTGIAMAVRLARKFQRRPPSVDELRDECGMSRATAYRWRAAFVDAMGLQR